MKWTSRNSFLAASTVALLMACGSGVEPLGETNGAVVTSETVFEGQAPTTPPASDTAAVELGVKFRSSSPGVVRAIRFYRQVAVGAGYQVHLYDNQGNELATGNVIEGQCPVPCWQEVSLNTPVTINANNVYIASYYTSQGGYSFTAQGHTNQINRGHLFMPASATVNGNGVYRYGVGGGFPTNSYQDASYWVDVRFEATAPPPGPQNIFGNVVPPNTATQDTTSVELGVKFTSNVAGTISAIRFYRAVPESAGYRVSLWSPSGSLLRQANAVEVPFPTPGWQTIGLFPPVAIEPGIPYVASYFALHGGYSYEHQGLANPVTSGSLTALGDGALGGNGVYRYTASSAFPENSYLSFNYFVDVVFTAASP